MMSSNGSRWLRFVAVLAAALMVLAACGSPADDDDDAVAPGDGEATEEDEGHGQEHDVTTIEDGTLTIGSDIPYPPFEFRKGGELTGFDIDIINEIATRLELEPSVVDAPFDTIFSQLAGARFDVVIAASTITPKREKEVNFSDPYYLAQQSLTVQSASGIASIDDLTDGMTVAVQTGTTGETYAEENVPEGVEIRSFPEGPDGYNALEAGAVDAVINDEPTALAEIAGREGLEVVQAIDTGEAYGIAVDPENEGLLEAVNEILAEMIDDGTYQEIYDKYPDLPPGGNVAAEA